LKLRYLLPILSLLLLQSCKQNDSAIEEHRAKEPKLNEAAAYNSQLGLAYLKQGNRSRAKHKLLLALSQAPDSPSVNASMGFFMEHTGEMDNAQKYYQKALTAAPNSGAQLNNYGAFLCRRGKYSEAEGYFLKAVNDVEYEHTAGAYENAGLCAMAIPDPAKAKHYFSKALEQDPSREQSLYELVNLEMKQARFSEALAYLQKYPELSLRDRALLAKGVEVAHQAGNTEVEADYKLRLSNFSDNTGEKNEYNNNNG
jgi:type IV pilus assembly protein PilF